MTVKIKLLKKAAELPKYATPGSAACDLRAVIDTPIDIEPGARALIPTGIAIELPSSDYVALICARSGLAFKRGLGLANGIGVIDSDYRGELCVALLNSSSEVQRIENGERIAQLMIMPVAIADFEIAKDLDETERGAGGFGSTGVK